MGLPRTDRVDELTLVQLGHVDVDPEVLTGGGEPLRAAIGAEQPIDDHLGEIAGGLPADGWRLVHRSAAQPGLGVSEVFAAPCGDPATGGWAMASLSALRPDGARILSADPGPIRVFPGRAARRAGLSLTWPDDLTPRAGSIPELEIRLRNQTDQVWSNDPEDSAHVLGWLLDSNGERLQRSPWHAHGLGDLLPTLHPGEMVMLPVAMASFEYVGLGRGTHQLDALVVALGLRSSAGSLTLL